MGKDSKPVLWQNVELLMKRRYGGERLGQFARDAKIGGASMTRIKKQETSVGVDVLDRIAENFGIEPWRLLLPGMVAPIEGEELPSDALQVAYHFDSIKDPAQRASAHAIIDLLLKGHVSPSAALETMAERLREIGAALAGATEEAQ